MFIHARTVRFEPVGVCRRHLVGFQVAMVRSLSTPIVSAAAVLPLYAFSDFRRIEPGFPRRGRPDDG